MIRVTDIDRRINLNPTNQNLHQAYFYSKYGRNKENRRRKPKPAKHNPHIRSREFA